MAAIEGGGYRVAFGKFTSVLLTAAALCVLGPATGQADQATDLVFAAGVLHDVGTGETIEYRHTRSGPDMPEFRSISNGTMLLALQSSDTGGREVLLKRLDGGQLRAVTPFPASAGNPLVMALLELSLRAMAQISGGSPFYLRNRNKESRAAGGVVTHSEISLDGKLTPAQAVTFQPFVNDKNAARMGSFSGLELKFVVSQDVPGGFASLSATTPERDGTRTYEETVEYTGMQEQ
jgi:hypothetical protein